MAPRAPLPEHALKRRGSDTIVTEDELGLWAIAGALGADDEWAEQALGVVVEHVRARADEPRSTSLRGALARASQWLLDHAPPGAGATIAVLSLRAREAVIAHAGDDVVYRSTRTSFARVVEPHTLLDAYRRTKALTPQEMAAFPYPDAIVKALGMSTSIEAEITTLVAAPHDDWLLASGDVVRSAGEPRICVVMKRVRDEPGQARREVLALAAGSSAGRVVLVQRGQTAARS